MTSEAALAVLTFRADELRDLRASIPGHANVLARIESAIRGVIAACANGDETRKALHALVRPDNGYCNQCRGHWLYRLDGSWHYDDGQHSTACKGKSLTLVSEGA